MATRRWTEEETRLALYLYFQLPFGQLDQRNPEIQKLAHIIGRSNSSVAMKLSNFASIDPKIVESGRKGLSGASNLDRQMWAQFYNDWTSLVSAAERHWDHAEVTLPTQRVKDVATPFSYEPYQGASTIQATIERRIGQKFFRRAVLANFDERCCITGIADVRLLNASHIKPWGVDEINRHNPANGFALSATFDRAFDRGLITIQFDGGVNISRALRENHNGPTRDYFSRYHRMKIFDPVRFALDKDIVEWHNNNIYVDR